MATTYEASRYNAHISSTWIPWPTAPFAPMEELQNVGRIVGRLSAMLPRRHFILLGPKRRGSRMDFRLGVSVTYSCTNHTGYRTGGLVEFRFVTDEEVEKKPGFASKIGAPADAALPL